VTRRLAKAGYACITLDPYSRIGGQSPRDFTTPEERRRKAFLASPDEQVVPDLEATRLYLESRDDVDATRIGAIGYCAGGGHLYSWILGNSSNITCAVVYYGATSTAADARPDGKAIDRITMASKLTCPILIHHGDADRAVSLDNARAMVAALEKTGQPVEFHIYAGADHAFHDDTHPAYHAGASEESWARTLAFFAKHLKPAR
jgi:carboxymethylenebutenolidase